MCGRRVGSYARGHDQHANQDQGGVGAPGDAPHDAPVDGGQVVRLEGTGIWAAQLRYGDPGLIAELAAELDELGYRALWIPDVGGDVLASVEVLLGATTDIGVATGILNVWLQDAADVAAAEPGGATTGNAGSPSGWA